MVGVCLQLDAVDLKRNSFEVSTLLINQCRLEEVSKIRYLKIRFMETDHLPESEFIANWPSYLWGFTVVPLTGMSSHKQTGPLAS